MYVDLDVYFWQLWKFISFFCVERNMEIVVNREDVRLKDNIVEDCHCLFWCSICGKSKNHENLIQGNSWVRVLIKIISVRWKLNTTEQLHQDRSNLFRRGDCRKKSHIPKNICPGFEYR